MVNSVAPRWTVPASVNTAVSQEVLSYRDNVQRANLERRGLAPNRLDTERQIAERELALLDLTANNVEAHYLDASGVINQQRALLDLQRSQLGASYADQQGVFAAQRALQVARTAEYQLALRQLEEKRSEFAQISAAEDNIANKAAVAAGRRDASVYDKRYGMAGLQVQEIQRPLDGVAPENLPPGVRYALETDAERLGRQFQRTGAARGLEAEGAGLNTTKYGLSADRVQTTFAEREAARGLAEGYQQFNVAGSQLNLNRGDLNRQTEEERRRIALEGDKQRLKLAGLSGIYGTGEGPLYG